MKVEIRNLTKFDKKIGVIKGIWYLIKYRGCLISSVKISAIGDDYVEYQHGNTVQVSTMNRKAFENDILGVIDDKS